MNEAKVGVFDDNKPIRGLLRQILEIDSHTVVVEAARMQEAIAVIEAMEDGDIDVALVDGNLDGPQRGGKDGELIASLLREKFSRVVVIGISGSDAIASAHINIEKSRAASLLGPMINDLPDAPSPDNI